MTVHIRIDGDPAEVKEAAGRLDGVFEIVGHSPQKPSRKKPGTVLVYMEADLEQHDGGTS